MPPPDRKLDYATPTPPSSDRSAPGCLGFLLVGPFTGLLVGATKTAVATAYWLVRGQPDFYVRDGWNGIWEHLTIMCVGGFVTGIAFGCAVWFVQALLDRQSRIRLHLLAAVVLATAVYVYAVGREFRLRQLDGFQNVFRHEGYIIAILGIATILFARPLLPRPRDGRHS
ncbi:MAG: hypothetical protein ACAI43_18230 [Phycisphaerae bacterium]